MPTIAPPTPHADTCQVADDPELPWAPQFPAGGGCDRTFVANPNAEPTIVSASHHCAWGWGRQIKDDLNEDNP